MIYKVSDSEHFNLVLRITPIENHRQFDAANFYQALRVYDQYEDMFFGKREESE